MANADCLSRLPMSVPTNVNSINSLNFSRDIPLDIQKIQQETTKDPMLVKLQGFIMSKSLKLPDELTIFKSKLNNLSCENGCLFYADRIIIPQNLQRSVLKLIHENHAGMVRMKMIARSYVWWYKIDQDIESFVNKCLPCQQTLNVPKEKVTTSWKPTTKPFERVHVDFFHFNGKTYFLFVDSYSKYIDIVLMNKTHAKAVIEVLIQIFSVTGLVTELIADNGPPFNSLEFKEFFKSHGIKYGNSPAYHAQSNGLSERHVQVVKNVFKKFLLSCENSLTDSQKLNKFLINQRNMPDTRTKRSPCDIIFNYKPKILLDLINPRVISKGDKAKRILPVRTEFNIIKSKYKKGDNIFYRNHFKEYIRWIPAKVIEICSPLTYLINVNNKIRFVHQNQIRISKLESNLHPSILLLPHSEFYKSQVVKENIVNSPIENENNFSNQTDKSELQTKPNVKSKEVETTNYHRVKPKRTIKPVDRFDHRNYKK